MVDKFERLNVCKYKRHSRASCIWKKKQVTSTYHSLNMNANALICVYERRSFKTLYSLVHTNYQCSDIDRQGEESYILYYYLYFLSLVLIVQITLNSLILKQHKLLIHFYVFCITFYRFQHW